MKLKLGCTQKTFSFDVADASEDKIFVFIDNLNRRPPGGRLATDKIKLDDTEYGKRFNLKNVYTNKNTSLRGAKRAYPITIYDDKNILWTDDKFNAFKKVIDDDFKHIYRAIDELNPKVVVFPRQGLLGGHFGPAVTPKIYAYILKKEMELLEYKAKSKG